MGVHKGVVRVDAISPTGVRNVGTYDVVFRMRPKSRCTNGLPRTHKEEMADGKWVQDPKGFAQT